MRPAIARLHALMDGQVDGRIVIGVDGIVQNFNSAAKKIFGYRDDEVVGAKVDRGAEHALLRGLARIGL
jgi:PAS domain S-box-containing protein